MNLFSKKIIGFICVSALAFGFFTISCKTNKGSANVAFAEENKSVSIPKDSLEIAVALQSTFRSISASVLPAVVEVDVIEVTKVQTINPFKDLPFFFGLPKDENSDDGMKERETASLGSGVIVRNVGNKYYVLTNNHVAGKASKIKIKLNDEREYDGKLIGADERMDIALICFESDDKNIVVAKLGDSDEVKQGDLVLALGSPLGYFASVTQGIVSAKGRSGGQIGSISDFIQTDAAINQGNSGGPLVNIYGEVIGINTWIASSSGGSQGLGFSIPINNIKLAIDQFIDNGKISYGWLGVSLLEVNEEYKNELGIPKGQTGALAVEIFIDSPAMKGGMQAGDYIISINGKKVKSSDQLTREVGSLKAGEKANFTVIRNGLEKELSVKIEGRDDKIVSDNSKLWPGIFVSPLDDVRRDQLKLDKKIKGVVVANVQEKTPAAVLRLQVGDIITAVNGVKVTNLKEFYQALDITDKTEIWFDYYMDGHTISTNKYVIEK